MTSKLESLNYPCVVDSAGTADYHIGASPDSRSMDVAKRFGYDISHNRARQVVSSDFYEFDYILAMDMQNLANLKEIKPADSSAVIELFIQDGASGSKDLPDPYYGKDKDFVEVIKLCEAASDYFIKAHINGGRN